MSKSPARQTRSLAVAPSPAVAFAAIIAACWIAQSSPTFAHPEIEAQLAHAGVLLSAGPADAETGIETALARAEQLISETGGEVMRPALALLRADLAAARGDREECERHRGEARRLYLAMGATAHAERIAARHSRPPR